MAPSAAGFSHLGLFLWDSVRGIGLIHVAKVATADVVVGWCGDAVVCAAVGNLQNYAKHFVN